MVLSGYQLFAFVFGWGVVRVLSGFAKSWSSRRAGHIAVTLKPKPETSNPSP